MYFALKGDNFDGNAFAQNALVNGAKWAVVDDTVVAQKSSNCILVDNVLTALQKMAHFHRQKMPAKVIGLTGSNGKTTTKELLQAVLAKKFETLATIGNLNNHIGVPLTLLRLKPNHEIAVVEMGANHQGEIAELSEIANPDMGMITNIGKAHMGTMGGIEGILKTKTELFDHLRAKHARVFVATSQPMLTTRLNQLQVTLYGKSPHAHYQGEYKINHAGLLEFRWWPKQGEVSPWITTKLVGAYNFDNILAAIAIGAELGVPHLDISTAIAEYSPSNNRSQLVTMGHTAFIMDAYNANPSSMAEALQNLQEITGKKGVVLGEMLELGVHADDEHRRMIQQAEKAQLNFALFVGDGFKRVANEWPNAVYCSSVIEAKSELAKLDLTDFTVLVKGSRRNRLEQLL